ncbi:type II toxin-antitoxin system VapB family antitoxin [Propylenella binzhouense]|uniref:type II toxin-antitoxin system VapB family antitoxin n=1 Tax=Propylenella binzhouense TaxID=2555902 RepID=UPI00136F7410
MAITIRNSATERIIRDIGRETGEGPSPLVTRWAHEALERRDREKAERRERRRKAVEKWSSDLPQYTDEDGEQVERIMDDMYDEWGLPR